MRRAAVAAACLLVLMAVASSPARAAPPTVLTVAIASSTLVDANHDGRYEALVVLVDVSVANPGVVLVEASVGTTSANQRNWTWTYLNATGPRTVSVSIPGPRIRTGDLHGPCPLRATASGYEAIDFGGSGSPAISATGTSPPFTPESFDPPWADFSGPPTNSTVDSDQDGLYDALIVHVPLQVYTPAPITLFGGVGIGRFYLVQAGGAGTRFLPAGPTVWDLRFEGRDLYAMRAYGYIFGTLTLTEGYLGLMNATSFQISPYTYNQFAPSSARITAPITSRLVDTNGNGRADTLVVHVPLNVTAAGNFSIAAMGSGPSPSGLIGLQRILPMQVGLTTVDLNVSGIYLSRLPAGSVLSLDVGVQRLGLDAMDTDSQRFRYFPVDPAAFESRPVVLLNVTAWSTSGRCSSLGGEAVDLATGFRAQNGSMNGTLTLPLYAGDFELAVESCNYQTNSTVMDVAVTPGATVNATVAYVPPSRTFTVRFSSWNESVVDVSGGIGNPGDRVLRFLADLAGNRDGTANDSELGLYLQSCCLTTMTSPLAGLSIDGIALDQMEAANLTLRSGAGPVASDAPVAAQAEYVLGFGGPPLPQAAHQIAVQMYYVIPEYAAYCPYTLRVIPPAGLEAHASLSGIYQMGIPLAVATNVSVLDQGERGVLLIPGGPPAGLSNWAVAVLTIDFPAAATDQGLIVTVAVFALAAVIVTIAAVLLYARRRREPPR